ncbi:MAG: chemotaxis protein CheW [Treponemataceae bacterium]|nr:chemotaxis protein CheW [Treponemataceae bacterium]
MTIESILVSEEEPNAAAVAVAESTGQDESRKQQVTIDFKMVTFSLSGKDYAIDIMHVKEIAKANHFTYVPNTLPFVIGVYNLRGEIIPILDMRIFFNIDVPERDDSALENLLILTVEEQTFGIIVDKIDKVVGVQKSSIRPPHPLFGDINVKYISGVVESNKHLYILLDILRIFTKGMAEESVQHREAKLAASRKLQGGGGKQQSPAVAEKKDAAPQKEEAPVPEAPAVDEQNLKFVAESLKSYKKFEVSPANRNWILSRLAEWKRQKKTESVLLQNEIDAAAFLQPFWSTATDGWWSREFAEAIEKLLPENSAKQICVWNPGCGKGYETYCLACVLAKKYPTSKIRVYAQDVDLLSISNAPMLAVPASEAKGWLAPYLSETASGSTTFSQRIKESIMFEYHDCLHTNALPMTDIIFARDLLSQFNSDAVRQIVADFDEKLKGNGILVIGEHEEIPESSDFMEYTVGTLTAYKKQ